MDIQKKMPSVALGTWSWGTGAVGGDQVFGNRLGENELREVFDTAMKEGQNLWDSAVVYGMGASEDIIRCRKEAREEILTTRSFLSLKN